MGGEQRGVEETEQHAQRTYYNHVNTAVEHQRQAYGTGYQRGDDYPHQHPPCVYPPHCTGARRTEAAVVVLSALEIEIVINEIRVNLHDESERHAEQRRDKAETGSPHFRIRQRQTNHHGDGRSAQGLGARGKHPRTKGILPNIICIKSHFILQK